MLKTIRRVLIGAPIATERSEHEKVGIFGGMAVFAADAMSSVAYGPEEVIIVLVAAGSMGLSYALPLCIALSLLVWIVATSYRQTVVEYPSGGGAYVVARENLGTFPSLVAGGALLTDYVLTVAVSVASGIAAIASAWPALYPHRVAIGVACIALIAVVNLRGVRESAGAFSLPVYGFIVCALATIAAGLYRYATGGLTPLPPPPASDLMTPLTLSGVSAFLVLRAFSSGCASLTGLEAVANGVQAFKEPRGPHAARVMVLMAVVLSSTVIGVGLLIHFLGVHPLREETVLSQIGEAVWGRGTIYFLLQITTMAILVFAANTSFSDFPRLSAFMARDGYMPRQMANLGDRLVFQNGIVMLAGLAIVLLVAFQGEVTRLIPLYAVGVFTAFTLSQTGMVLHWARKRDRGWHHRAVVNSIGAVSTAIVLVVIAVTKFALGAWIICLLIPLLVMGFRGIGRHYRYVASRLSLERAPEVVPKKNLTLLLVGGMHRGTLEALEYLHAFPEPVRAVHIEAGGESEPRIKRLWNEWEPQIPLLILPSPYRNLYQPLVDYIETAKREEGFDSVTVVLPEFVVDSWWQSLLHNQSALLLQLMLRRVPGVSLVNMRYQL